MGLWDDLKAGAQEATSKAVEMKDIAKLNLEIAEAQRGLDKTYQALGRQYYETQQEAAREAFSELTEAIEAQLSEITELKKKVQILKGEA